MIYDFDEEELAAARLSRPGVLLSHDEGNERKVVNKILLAGLALTLYASPAFCQPSTGGPVMPPPFWNPLTAPGKNPVSPYQPIQILKSSKNLSQEYVRLREHALTFQSFVNANKLEEASKELKTILAGDLTLIDQITLLNSGLRSPHHHGYFKLFDQSHFILRDLRTLAEQAKNHDYALQIESQILDSEKKFFSPNDTRVAATLLSIGNVYYSKQDYKQALKHYKQSWDIQKLYMTEHEAVANMGERFIKSLIEEKDTPEAFRIQRLVNENYNRKKEGSRVANLSSSNLTPQNKLVEALKRYKEYSKYRPYGYEVCDCLEVIVQYSNGLKRTDLVCQYTPLLLDVLIRRNKPDDFEFKKHRQNLVSAKLALGKLDEARSWVDIIESKTEPEPTLHELIELAKLEIKVKRLKNAERFLDKAESQILDNFAALPTMRQIETTWKQLGRDDRAGKIQKRIAPLDKSLPRLNPYTGTYMTNDERYKDAALKADAKLEEVKVKLRRQGLYSTEHFYDEMNVFLQMQSPEQKMQLKLKILDLAKAAFKARLIKEGRQIAFVVGFHPSYDAEPIKLALAEVEIAELIMQLNLEKNQYGSYQFEEFADHARGFCGESNDPKFDAIRNDVSYRLRKIDICKFLKLQEKPIAGMTWPQVDVPHGLAINRDMIAAKSIYQHFNFNTEEESVSQFKSCQRPNCPVILKPGQSFPPAKNAPSNAKILPTAEKNFDLAPGDYTSKTASFSSLGIKSPGTVRLFLSEQSVVDGPVFIAKKLSRINSDSAKTNFEIWYQGEGTIQLEDGCCFGGTIYAPNARVEIGKDFKLKGSIAARDIWLAGTYSKF